MTIRSYIDAHRDRFLEEWASLIRIPSVSCQPAHKQDMLRCAERWCELLLEAGAQKAQIMPSEGHPFVYAEYSPVEVKGERLEVKGEDFGLYAKSTIPTIIMIAPRTLFQVICSPKST